MHANCELSFWFFPLSYNGPPKSNPSSFVGSLIRRRRIYFSRNIFRKISTFSNKWQIKRRAIRMLTVFESQQSRLVLSQKGSKKFYFLRQNVLNTAHYWPKETSNFSRLFFVSRFAPPRPFSRRTRAVPFTAKNNQSHFVFYMSSSLQTRANTGVGMPRVIIVRILNAAFGRNNIDSFSHNLPSCSPSNPAYRFVIYRTYFTRDRDVVSRDPFRNLMIVPRMCRAYKSRLRGRKAHVIFTLEMPSRKSLPCRSRSTNARVCYISVLNSCTNVYTNDRIFSG